MAAGYVGPTDETRGEWDRRASWKGLSDFDGGLLERFIEGLAVRPDEIHCHIPIGVSDADGLPAEACGHETLYRKMWSRRIDCSLRFGNHWWLIECKRACAHYVVGQCLCYAFWWHRDCPECELTRVIVVTDKCCADVRCVLEFCGIDVVELDLEPNEAPGVGIGSPGRS